jgi:hypothetical protein
VVAAEGDDTALPDEVDAFLGLRPVPDDIAQADDGLGLEPVQLFADGLEGVVVRVDVADYGNHRPLLSTPAGSAAFATI